MRTTENTEVYQVKITLSTVTPPVWRRVLVSNRMNLIDLHDVIIGAFGWQDYHLHEFTIRGIRYGEPDEEMDGEREVWDDTRVRLNTLGLMEGNQFKYTYDFGDDWEHTLVVEKITPFEKGMKLPRVVTGKRACPPEDVGGPYGYERFLEAINDPNDPEHKELLVWAGGKFDPELFDLEAANQRLNSGNRGDWPDMYLPDFDDGPVSMSEGFDPAGLVKLFPAEYAGYFEALPLRKDMLSFMQFLKEKKVKGTAATGNLPLNTIREITARFVKPPDLDITLDDTVYKFRSEIEIWPMYFIHVLAHITCLVSGGAARQWQVTPVGERYMAYPPVAQVSVLFVTWWYRTNWKIATKFSIFAGDIPYKFRHVIDTYLRNMQVDTPVQIESFTSHIISQLPGQWGSELSDHNLWQIETCLIDMVVNPLESLGIFLTQCKIQNRWGRDFSELKTFTLTRPGQVLLKLFLPEERPGG